MSNIPWIEVQKVQSHRQELGLRRLSDQECLALEAVFTKQSTHVDQSGRSRLTQNKDSAGSNPVVGNNNGDLKMADDTVSEVTATTNENLRFKVDEANPLLFVDLLTKKKYRLVSDGEPEPATVAQAPKHLLKTAAKTVLSLNNRHQHDYFWGDIFPASRRALTAAGIMNMDDIANKTSNLAGVPAAALVEVIKMMVSNRYGTVNAN